MLNRYIRRNYLINKRFQLKYTLSILLLLFMVTMISGVGLYMGMWTSIIENISEFKVSQDLETAKRIANYEGARYMKGDYRLRQIAREAELLSLEQQKSLKKALRAINRSLFPKIVILALFIFIGGIFASHRVAGPMYRFEHSAKAVKEGDLRTHFMVRKGDEMKKAANVLEEMIETLRVDIERIKAAKTIEEIQKIVSRYKT